MHPDTLNRLSNNRGFNPTNPDHDDDAKVFCSLSSYIARRQFFHECKRQEGTTNKYGTGGRFNRFDLRLQPVVGDRALLAPENWLDLHDAAKGANDWTAYQKFIKSSTEAMIEVDVVQPPAMASTDGFLLVRAVHGDDEDPKFIDSSRIHKMGGQLAVIVAAFEDAASISPDLKKPYSVDANLEQILNIPEKYRRLSHFCRIARVVNGGYSRKGSGHKRGIHMEKERRRLEEAGVNVGTVVVTIGDRLCVSHDTIMFRSEIYEVLDHIGYGKKCGQGGCKNPNSMKVPLGDCTASGKGPFQPYTFLSNPDAKATSETAHSNLINQAEAARGTDQHSKERQRLGWNHNIVDNTGAYAKIPDCLPVPTVDCKSIGTTNKDETIVELLSPYPRRTVWACKVHCAIHQKGLVFKAVEQLLVLLATPETRLEYVDQNRTIILCRGKNGLRDYLTIDAQGRVKHCDKTKLVQKEEKKETRLLFELGGLCDGMPEERKRECLEVRSDTHTNPRISPHRLKLCWFVDAQNIPAFRASDKQTPQ